jgi:hypothetical protein
MQKSAQKKVLSIEKLILFTNETLNKIKSIKKLKNQNLNNFS